MSQALSRLSSRSCERRRMLIFRWNSSLNAANFAAVRSSSLDRSFCVCICGYKMAEYGIFLYQNRGDVVADAGSGLSDRMSGVCAATHE